MRFAHPEAFLLGLFLPLYMWWVWFQKPTNKGKGIPLPTYQYLKLIHKRFHWKLWLPRVFWLFGFIFLILALARPQAGREVTLSKQKGIDIILALDTSGSMLAEDFQPNRLEAAKRVIVEFIRLQQNNRIGVVVFAGRSFTLLPLTTDYSLVAQAVQEIHPHIVKIDGTAIGDGIANAIYRFKQDNLKSRVLILLTDGENTAGNIRPLVAAEVARQKNIRIYTIGMGKTEGVPIPVTDPRTGRRYYARDRNGNLYLSRVNGEELAKIAQITGGQYFQADNPQKLTAIYQKIAAMEKTTFETRRIMLYQERMLWFALPALLLMLLAQGLQVTVGRILRV